MLMIILAAGAVAAAGAPEATPPAPVAGVTVEGAKEKKAPKKVCYEETMTGSHRSQKVCRIQGQYDTQDNVLRDRIRERAQGDSAGLGGGAR